MRSHGKITRQSQPLTQYNIQKQRKIETEDTELNNYMYIFPFSGEVRERDSSVYVLVLDNQELLYSHRKGTRASSLLSLSLVYTDITVHSLKSFNV